MIDNIIEESYQNKIKTKKKAVIYESEKNEVFNNINNENLDSSTLIKNKVQKADITINSNIDSLLSFSVVNSTTKFTKKQFAELKKELLSSEPIIKSRKKQSKYLFKGDLSISEKVNRTKFKEFSFLSKNRKINSNLLYFSNMNKTKNRNIKNIKNNKLIQSNSFQYSIERPRSVKIDLMKKRRKLNIGNDSFFITKVPQSSFLFQNRTNITTNKLNSKSSSGKEQKFREMKKIIKESNSQMLDIYTGLKNIKQNKIIISSSIMDSTPKTKEFNLARIKSGKCLRNIDKFLNLDSQKNISVSSINHRFQTLFQKIFHNKRFSNEKLDARTIMDPLEKILKGGYKEIKMDNTINQSLGQRIWIKKTTANMVSYGKSCEKLSDDIFYKERKRIIAIYPKIEEEAKMLVPKKKIDKRNPLFIKLVKNINRINDVFLKEYDLLKRVKKRMEKNKIK